jgi:hypothetical protein
VVRLDQGDRYIGLVVEDEIGLFGLAARDQLAAHDDPAFGEIKLLANLQHLVPARALDGGQDKLRADIAFAYFYAASSRSKAPMSRLSPDLHHPRMVIVTP